MDLHGEITRIIHALSVISRNAFKYGHFIVLIFGAGISKATVFIALAF